MARSSSTIRLSFLPLAMILVLSFRFEMIGIRVRRTVTVEETGNE